MRLGSNHPMRLSLLVLLLVLAACGNVPEWPGSGDDPLGLAPSSPAGLEALPGDGKVHLRWEADGEAGPLGYHVYRGTDAVNVRAEENRLTLEPQTATSYLDTGLDNGTTYYYVVTALDTTGRESAAQAQPASALPQPEAGQLTAEPSELIFSGVQGQSSAVQSLTLTNRGDAAVEIRGLTLGDDHAAAFTLSGMPSLPLSLEPGGEVSVNLAFTPARGQLGSLSATLEVDGGPADGTGVVVGLYGLSARGVGGRAEPTLQAVVDTLGYAIDIGSGELEFGRDPAPLGDEVLVSRFQRAGPGEVSIRPVARYSPDEVLPFGYYSFDGVIRYNQVAQIDVGQDQTLNPAVAAGGAGSFDPGDLDFGIYVRSENFGYTTHSEGHLNTAASQLPRAVRVYPLKDRSGEEIANSFLLAFEDFSNGDFQDYVFVISNVVPATSGPTPTPHGDAVLPSTTLL